MSIEHYVQMSLWLCTQEIFCDLLMLQPCGSKSTLEDAITVFDTTDFFFLSILFTLYLFPLMSPHLMDRIRHPSCCLQVLCEFET